MKWHRIPTTWWNTETAEGLVSVLGYDGVVGYLKIVSHICLEVNSEEEYLHLIENGWRKTEENWRKISGFSRKKFQIFVEFLQNTEKIEVEFQKNSVEFLNLKFKDIEQFLYLRDSRWARVPRQCRVNAASMPCLDKRREEKRRIETDAPAITGASLQSVTEVTPAPKTHESFQDLTRQLSNSFDFPKRPQMSADEQKKLARQILEGKTNVL